VAQTLERADDRQKLDLLCALLQVGVVFMMVRGCCPMGVWFGGRVVRLSASGAADVSAAVGWSVLLWWQGVGVEAR
jgi:hypothetical protein